MKEIASNYNPSVIGLKKSLLEEAGIECFVRNESLSLMEGAGPTMPPIYDPVLCVVDDSRRAEALALLETPASVPAAAEWRCPRCGETVPGNFNQCWNCSSEPAPKA